ncbi:hypothetical protein [Desulfotignum balticum]|uniref:hypothetical protein n=1 Tax=Desulfotignum balticum TaxID=115781 RepID=UPI0004127A55|nr:hypothetical protein [Desulfotignum balticum]
MPDQVTIYNIRLSYHRPAEIQPTTLAMSWGSDTTAVDAVEKMFGCIPFPYHLYVGVEDTPTSLQKRLNRMRDPESLYKARRKRIRAYVMKKDPLFYDQFIGPALENDAYTLEYYRQRQKDIADMHRKISVKPDRVGKLWINPEAERLKHVDWLAFSNEE